MRTWFIVFTCLLAACSAEMLEEVDQLLKQQQESQAMQLFLFALEESDEPQPPASPLYEQFLARYLASETPDHAGRLLAKEIAPLLEADPQQPQLAMLYALAIANQGDMERFYPLFYPAYQAMPSHYLVDKVRGILAIRIYERTADPEQRLQMRDRAVRALWDAYKKEPRDEDLPRIYFKFGEGDLLAELVTWHLETDRAVPRSALLAVTQDLLEQHPKLAQLFVQRCTTWFSYSRQLAKAERLIQSHKE